MKKLITFLLVLAVLFIFSLQAEATLFNRGTDSLGNRLIYDDDRNITWYDYSRSYDTWQNQLDWADALSVTFGSNTYTSWRLPTTMDGSDIISNDGSTTAGFNNTLSELGHLFYTELGNSGIRDTSGNFTSCASSSCLTNTDFFQNLLADRYWSSTEWSTNPDEAWYFNMYSGIQNKYVKSADNRGAIAVLRGDVTTEAGLPTTVPEPATMLLLGSGLLGLGAFRRKFKK